MSSVTIRDVARRAGVGVGTVSRVLNDSPAVSGPTRQRVLTAIKELNYAPNPLARQLSLGKTMNIGVIVPFFTRPSFVERLRGVEQTLGNTAYDLVLYNVESVERRDRCFREVPRRERVDGLLVMTLTPTDADVARFLESGVPTVLVDTYHPDLNCVTIDDVAGGHQATCHLIALGHRRIGFVGDLGENPFDFSAGQLRLRGYRRALREAGLPEEPAHVQQGHYGRREARRMALALLALPEPPTAIFAASDTMAIGVAEAAAAAGLRVPADLSIVGFDDIEIAAHLKLTTIRQPLFRSGVEGVTLLLDTLRAAPPQPVNLVLPTELVSRATTAPPGSSG